MRLRNASLAIERPETSPLRTPRPLVFLAEDDVQMRRLLRQQLEREGYAIRESASGGDLFEALRSARGRGEPPALVLTDLRMPGVSVLEIFPLIRGWGWTLPVLLITAFGDEEIRAEALARGASAMLSKPFDLDELVELMRRLLPSPA